MSLKNKVKLFSKQKFPETRKKLFPVFISFPMRHAWVSEEKNKNSERKKPKSEVTLIKQLRKEKFR